MPFKSTTTVKANTVRAKFYFFILREFQGILKADVVEW